MASTVAGSNPGQSPVANFTASRMYPPVGSTVNFTDTSTNNPTSWQWSVNGALFSTIQNPSLYISAPGAYQILLTATNQFGSGNDTQILYTPGG